MVYLLLEKGNLKTGFTPVSISEPNKIFNLIVTEAHKFNNKAPVNWTYDNEYVSVYCGGQDFFRFKIVDLKYKAKEDQ